MKDLWEEMYAVFEECSEIVDDDFCDIIYDIAPDFPDKVDQPLTLLANIVEAELNEIKI